jgi:hypothetical protein
MTIKATSTEIVVHPIQTESLTFAVLGTTPIILNRLAEKARHELLLPAGRKTAADKASNLKHDPLAEFRASPYTLTDPEAPTLLAHMASAIKGAMSTAALDMPGAKKAQIGRLAYVEGTHIPIYGIPELFMAITRSADMNRTPDVRTRAIVPRWATTVTITFAAPILNARSITNLLAAAGVICGIGDWRPEKGKGSFGQFTLVDPTDERYLEVIATAGRAAQVEAMADPKSYDQETEELLAWFETEVDARGKRLKVVA